MIRLLLVDGQTLICQGLKIMLELQPDLQVVGLAGSGEVAVEQVAALQPDLVLMMDLRIAALNSREATQIISHQYPGTKVLVLSMLDDARDIANFMQAGAKGYLLKDIPSEELVQVIRLVHRGYTQLGPGLLEKLMATISNPQVAESESTSSNLFLLTNREQEVLRLVGNGSTNREIAEQLHIAEGTVKTHVTRLLNRLSLRNRAQLAVWVNSTRTNIKSDLSLAAVKN